MYAQSESSKMRENRKDDALSVTQLVHQDDWVCDYERTLCSVCTRNFNTFRRKHHCRMCGEVVCGSCTLHKNVNLASIGVTRVRVCISCIMTLGATISLQKDANVYSPRSTPAPTLSPCSQVSDDTRQWMTNHLHSPASKSSEGEHIYTSTHFNNQNNNFEYELDFNWQHPWPKPPIPNDEDTRLNVLYGLNILDTPKETIFNDICEAARDRLACPMAAVSFMDQDRQWFKASLGLAQPSLSRQVSFCAHAIISKEPLVVLDTFKDLRFQHNPLVTGTAAIRFYASAPICEAVTGIILGTVFVLDIRPRESCDISILERLANIAMENLNVKMFTKIQQRNKGVSEHSTATSSRNSRESNNSNNEGSDIVPCTLTMEIPHTKELLHSSSVVVSSTMQSINIPNNATTVDTAENPNKMENLLMSLLCRTTETQQQLANQQISMSTTLGDHSAKIDKLAYDLARMEAKLELKRK